MSNYKAILIEEKGNYTVIGMYNGTEEVRKSFDNHCAAKAYAIGLAATEVRRRDVVASGVEDLAYRK